jgi:hypothetical protein
MVPVYGLGTYGEGRPYYAMRLIRGDSLKEAIDHFRADTRSANPMNRRRQWESVGQPPSALSYQPRAAGPHSRSCGLI